MSVFCFVLFFFGFCFLVFFFIFTFFPRVCCLLRLKNSIGWDLILMFLVFLQNGKAVGIYRGQKLTLEWPVEVGGG